MLTRHAEGNAIARAIDWTRYDTLKAQGLADREIARQWGIPWGTFPREKQKREASLPVQTPPVPHQTPRVSQRVSQGVPMQVLPSVPQAASTPDMTPLLHDILQALRTLTQGLAGRVSPQTPPVSEETPQVPERVSDGVSQGVPRVTREKTARWNLHLPIDLITKTKVKAQTLGVHPSELVAEVLRRWLEEEARQ